MKNMQSTPLWIDINPRAYAKPTVVRFRTPASQFSWAPAPRVLYAVCGTAYGYLHTTAGDVRTWGSYSGARKAAKAYQPL
jgi:hypothetical protein